ncbi:hypothetical protein A5634_11405 [Mycobacterium asiaticum]|uniref:PE domain-containing protein n=1 Tax=Mycobacterium asiaticum TaxID=1790 RepID=A0A1A3NIT9_MYCAS|nr:hypothetical protein A5634_11405 [Mycobacterium asiaticum]
MPEFLGTAAHKLAGIGSTISASNTTAAAPTIAVSAAAGDQVSAAVAAFFSGHARSYQTLGAQVAQFHAQFVQALSTNANAYATAEAANATPMQHLTSAADNVPVKTATAVVGTSDSPISQDSPPAARAAVPLVQRPATVRAVAMPATGMSERSGGGSAAEATAAGANGAAGGLWMRPTAVLGANGSGRVLPASGSGGLLSRLVGTDGNRGSTGVTGRVSGGVGVGVMLFPAAGDLRAGADALVSKPSHGGSGGSAERSGLRGAGWHGGAAHGGASGGTAQPIAAPPAVKSPS